MADVGSLGTRLLRIVLGLCALVLVLLALYVSLGRQLVPLVAEYRQQLEDEAGKQLGIPVRIAELTGSWRGFEPLVVARDIQVGDGEQSLRLARVRLAPDLLGSLLARQVRIGSLELEGLKLTLREGEDGQWSLDGLPHSDKPSDPRKLLQFLLQTQRISLLDSQLEVAPRGSAALSLSAVGATLRSSSVGGQSLDARLQLPDGQPLALHAEGRIDSEDWPRSSARFYLSLPQSDWAQWLPAGLTQEWKIVRAKAGGDFWFDWRDGKAQRLVARLLAPQLKASYAARKPVEINDLGMNLFFDREAQGWKVRVGDLAANFGEQRWGEVELLLRRDQQNNEPHWKLQADRVDLTPLVPAIEALAPLPDVAAEWVAGLKPKGILHNLNADFWPQREVPERVSYATNLEKVGISAFHEVPAVENVSGTLTGTLAGGQLDASAQDFMLHLAKVFPEPWRYREARTRMFWSLDDRAFTLGSHLMRVEGEEGSLAGDMLIRLMRDPGAEDYMDLQVGLSDGDARFTAKYLPTQLPGMNKSLANWLKTAIRSGHVEQGYFQWQGSLNRGAAAEAHVMNLYFKVRDGELAYQPGWPALSKTVGEVFVEDSGVRVLASSGNLLNSRVSDVKVDIPLGRPGQTPHLYVDGAVDSNLKDGIKLLQEAPIPTRKIFAGWEGDGPLQGHLKLDIPLDHDEAGKTGVVVDFSTVGATLKMPSPKLDMSEVKGDFRFDLAKGLSAPAVQARVLGSEVRGRIVAEGRGDARTRLLLNGQVAVKSLSDWLGAGQRPLPVSGRLPFHLNLLLDGKDSQLQIDSDLKGAVVDLPAPFGKTAAQARPTQWRMTLDGAERRYWARYDGLASLAYAAPADKPLNGRGALRLGGDPALLPSAQGLRVRGRLAELDWDAWQATLKRYGNGDQAANSAAGLLRGADLRIDSFKGFGQELKNLTVDLARQERAWQLVLVSDLASGRLVLPDARGAPIVVDLDRLNLPKSTLPDENKVEDSDPLAAVDPRSLPAVDVKIGQVALGGQPLGAWSLKVRPGSNGVAFNDLDLDLRGLHVNGSLRWDGSPGNTRSTYQGRIEGKNLADVLKAWNFAPSATSERFRMDINGQWPGSPAYMALKRFSGSMDASLRKGQFVEVEGSAQALRVFGLLNFNAINRRLRLDFSDILGKGLSYDRVKGVLSATDGVYITREPLKLEGPSSNLELNGTLDLAHDRVDAKLLVTLPLTNNLTLAALIVGGPAVGGAVFVVDKLLGDRVSRFASVQYSVKGPWQDPKISFDKPFEKPR
ncbi:TPA: TIGR02099 family protein [Pseudomonas aeruginosa]|nr:TIGR02099 family protein [Pseudomonas aeruginosa]